MDCLVDTNVLLRWVDPARADHQITRAAVRALKRQGDTLFVASRNLVEFWNVSTRPIDRNGFGKTPAEADTTLRVVEDNFPLLEDSPKVYAMWRRLVVAHEVRGVQVHDARLAAAMLTHGLTRILTFNTSDFARFPGIEILNPQDLPYEM